MTVDARKIQSIFEQSAWLLTCYKNSPDEIDMICRFNQTWNNSEYKRTIKDVKESTVVEEISDMPFDIESVIMPSLSFKSKDDDLQIFDTVDSMIVPDTIL